MLRAKIDLGQYRQPSFLLRPRTVTVTVSSQDLRNTQFPRFGAGLDFITSKGTHAAEGRFWSALTGAHRRSHELAA